MGQQGTIAGELLADLADSYGIYCYSTVPVTGGWLNKKWRAETNCGTLLIKQYSFQRFTLAKLKKIDSALKRQMALEAAGVPCPHIFPVNGHTIRMPDAQTAYTVMEFCPGKMENCHTITGRQMYGLGSTCALLHKSFAALPAQEADGFPIDSGNLLSSLRKHYHTCAEEFPIGHKAVSRQKAILDSLSPAFFDRLPKGIAHEDFAPDNILFHPEGVAAILDFDRNCYSFPWHDIGRALLSFALRGGHLDPGLVRAFLDGYSSRLPLGMEQILDALRITGCIEIPWWIQASLFKDASIKPARFRDEITWLMEHWFCLGEALATPPPQIPASPGTGRHPS